MPEMQEVFRLATNKVKPDPNALERQHRRQRRNARQSRRGAYLAVAAVIAVVAVGAFTIMGPRNGNDEIPGTAHPPVRRRSRSSRRSLPARTRRRRRSSIFGGTRLGR